MSYFVTLENNVVVGGLFLAQQNPEQVELGDNDPRVLAFKATLAKFSASVAETHARTAAKAMLGSFSAPAAKALRGMGVVQVDEINLLRDWIMDFKAAVAAATTLADLKTRVANLANLPDRTITQYKSAVLSQIDGGA